MKKYFILAGILICLLGTTACSKNAEKESKDVTQDIAEDNTTKSVKPTGNLEMRDKDGNVRITIEDVEAVEVAVNEYDGRKDYCVGLIFTDEGAKKFADVTTELIGQSLGIYVDDELVSNPTIQCAITNGEAQISNFESYEEAAELVKLIRGSDKTGKEESAETPMIKITENDGTILVTEKEIDNYYVESRSIGKGGSSVTVIVIEFTDEGKEIMAEKTAKLIGEEINLVIKGDLVYDTKLEEPIEDGEMLLLGFDTEEERYKVTNKLGEVIK